MCLLSYTYFLALAGQHSDGRVTATDNACLRYTPALSVEFIVLTVIATKHLKFLRHFL